MESFEKRRYNFSGNETADDVIKIYCDALADLDMLRAILWNNPGKSYALNEIDLIMAEMSALFWKRFNGPIKMITDRIGYEYLINSPLADVYDEILPVLDTRCCGIDPTKYWAAAKIQAMSRLPLPCTIIDMDMLVLKPLDLSGEKNSSVPVTNLLTMPFILR